MDVQPLPIDGAWLVTPHRIDDDRGSFLEWYRADVLDAAVGRRLELAQANTSISRRGVLRGIHFSDVPPGQAKYVSCVRGAVLDVVVDIRVGSPTYGEWAGVRLDDAERQAVYLAEGLGHAFVALADDSVVSYLCSTPYSPGREHAVSPLDLAVGIEWPDGLELVLSEKDRSAPSLAAAAAAGLLPSHSTCQEYAERLRKAGSYT